MYLRCKAGRFIIIETVLQRKYLLFITTVYLLTKKWNGSRTKKITPLLADNLSITKTDSPHLCGMKNLPIDKALFTQNRKRFIAEMKPDSIAIFNSNDEMPMNGDAL